jgi:hypothetical protein
VKTFLIALVFLIIGGIVGGFLALAVGAGLGAGAGIVTGFEAGACSTLMAAKDQGLITEEQFGQVLGDAARKIADRGELPPETDLADTAADCEQVMAKLQEAAAKP